MLFSCAFLPLAICAPAAGRMRRPSSCSRGRCSGAPCGGPAPAAAGRSPPPPREARPRRRRRRIQRAGAAGGAAARPWGREGEGSSGLWQLGSPSCYALLPLGRSAVCLYGGLPQARPFLGEREHGGGKRTDFSGTSRCIILWERNGSSLRKDWV